MSHGTLLKFQPVIGQECLWHLPSEGDNEAKFIYLLPNIKTAVQPKEWFCLKISRPYVYTSKFSKFIINGKVTRSDKLSVC